LLSLAYQVIRWIFGTVAWIVRSSRGQALEVLRHQLEILKRQVSRPQFQPRDRVLLAAASRFLPKARWSSFIVRPETLLKWHRHLVTRRAARWGSRRRGRPPIPLEVKVLIVRLANDNPRWGYKRIRGELLKLGHDVSAMTIRNILRRHGLGPAPRRSGVGAENSIRLHAARSYSWIRPPRTSRLITDSGGASKVAEGDLGTGGLMSRERWGR
jgi:putative transposase